MPQPAHEPRLSPVRRRPQAPGLHVRQLQLLAASFRAPHHLSHVPRRPPRRPPEPAGPSSPARKPNPASPAIGPNSNPASGASGTTRSTASAPATTSSKLPTETWASKAAPSSAKPPSTTSSPSAASRSSPPRTPHAYGALWQLQDRWDPELALHPGDLEWSGALQVSWPFDDMLEPLPGLELHLTAGHFAGHTVLYDRPRKILFCGDALKFELDPADPRRATTISAHKAFVRGIPLTPNELRALPPRLRRPRLHPDLDSLRTGPQQRPPRSPRPHRRHARNPAPRLPASNSATSGPSPRHPRR